MAEFEREFLMRAYSNQLSAFSLVVILLLTLGLSLSTWAVQAQDSFTGRLLYLREDESTREYVGLSAQDRWSYAIPPESCVRVSPEGTYFAESSMQGADLVIRRLDAQQTIVLQTPWLPEWELCFFGWLGDTTLSIRRQGTTDEFFHYDISSGALVAFDFQPSIPQYPELPNWLSYTENNFILPSPNPHIFLYERCISGMTTRSGNSCAGNIDFVIYDTAEQRIIHVLVDASPRITGRYEFDAGIVAWSPDGRYLAFEHIGRMNSLFDLSVYDLVIDQYLNTSHFANVRINSQQAIQWSPQGNILAFWVIGSLTSDEVECPPCNYRTLVFFDANVSTFTRADSGYDFWFGVAFGLWSPDGRHYAFYNQNYELIYADAATGTTAALDTYVNGIIAWRSEE